ncbi:MAG: hypothetical protein U0414_40385 [Polyangiaceae bacterium]
MESISFTSLEHPSKSLFWTALVSEGSEMNTEDPLGLDYIAQQVGLILLPTLTTRSNRAQAFATVLYGLHIAGEACERYGLPRTDDSRRALFERWERFWALATLEFRGGVIGRGDGDSMRGIRGAKNAWRPGEGRLPLDFPLISRQQELGNLGAYLVPLRRSGLVVDGGVKPTPAALDILDGYWDEPGENTHVRRYDEYTLTALDPGRSSIERKAGNLTLGKVGQRSRLLSLIAARREPQQRRLYAALLERARDPSTLAVTEIVEQATRAGVAAPRDVLAGALDGRFGSPSAALRDQLLTARAFGDFMQALLGAFDRSYDALDRRGWVASRAQVIDAAIDGVTHAALQDAARRLLDTPAIAEIRRLPMHGEPCLRLADELTRADRPTTLELMLAYHARVQRDRRHAASWIRDEGGKLVLAVTSYSANPASPRFPSYKLDVLRTLLVDVGRLPFVDASAEVGP